MRSRASIAVLLGLLLVPAIARAEEMSAPLDLVSIRRQFASESPRTRLQAFERLHECDSVPRALDDEVVEALVRTLDTEHRMYIGLFLMKHERFARPLGAALEARLTRATSEQRYWYAGMAITLGHPTPRAIHHALSWYRDASREARDELGANLADMLRAGGQPVAEAIRPMLRTGRVEDRLWALSVLEWMPEGGAWAARPDLARMLDDPDPRIRVLAAKTVGFVGPGATEAIPQLESRVADGVQDVRVAAVEALANIAGEQPTLRAWLLETIQRGRGSARFAAVWGLSFLTPPAVAELVDLLGSEAPGDLRAVAVRALARHQFELAFTDRKALHALRDARKDPDRRVRRAALTILIPDPEDIGR